MPQKFLSDPQDSTAALMVDWGSIGAVVTTLSAATFRHLTEGLPLLEWVLAFGIVVLLGGPALVRRCTSIPATYLAQYYMFAGAVLAGVAAWSQGGLSSVAAVWLPLAPLWTALTGSRSMIWWSGGTAATLLTGVWLTGSQPASSAATYVNLLALCGASVLLGQVSHRQYEKNRAARYSSLNFMRALTASSPVGNVAIVDGEVHYSNPAAQKLLPHDATTYLENFLKLEPELPAAIQFVGSDGVRRFLEVMRHPFRVHGRKTNLISLLDLTSHQESTAEHIRSQSHLAEMERMEQMGVLAGGVAHDFNNLLTGMLANSSLLGEEVEDPEHKEMAEDIRVAAEQAAHLVGQLLAVAGRSRLVMTELDVTAHIQACLGLHRSEAHRLGVSLAFEPHSVPLLAMADPSLIGQVVNNLISNALTACSPSGTVQIRTQRLTLDSEELQRNRFSNHPAAGPFLVIDVRDAGVGMTPATLERILEPFYTTRSEGMGLGLAAIQSAILRVNGALFIESTPGKGTRFRAAFPYEDVPEPAATDPEPRAQPNDSSPLRVLILDDEPLVRSQITRCLVRSGISVEEAGDLSQALEQMRRGRFELVLIDYLMPDASGDAALLSLREVDPEIPAVLCSGYVSATASASEWGFQGEIMKPFVPEHLTNLVRRLARAVP